MTGDVDFDNGRGLEERDIFTTLEKLGHGTGPNRRSPSNTRSNTTHWRVIVIADPGRDEKVGGVTKGPVIPEIIGGAGFDGNGIIFDIQKRV